MHRHASSNNEGGARIASQAATQLAVPTILFTSCAEVTHSVGQQLQQQPGLTLVFGVTHDVSWLLALLDAGELQRHVRRCSH